MEIRPYRPTDLEALQDIRALAFAAIFRSFRDILGPSIADVALASAEAEQAKLLSDLCDPNTPQQVFVAVQQGRPIGFVSISLSSGDKVGEIGLNAVHPDFCGKGIGTRLYNFALQTLKEAGMKAAIVGTGGDSSHAPARRAYEKAGFGPSIPNLFMYRLL